MTDIDVVSAAGDVLGEAPLWDPGVGIWWIDVKRSLLQRWSGDLGRQTWLLEETPGSLGLAEGGRLLIALRSGLATFDPETGSLEPLAAIEADLVDNRLNDGRTDPAGRFWVGSMHDGERERTGALYRFNGSVTRVFGGVGIPNSLAWSPDGGTMYFAETLDRVIYAFDYDLATGEIGERRIFAEVSAPGYPDGSTVDAEGFLWNAEYAGWRLVRYAPDGTVVRTVRMPTANPTCPCFGGEDLDVLYVTTARQDLAEDELDNQPAAGSLLGFAPGVEGSPPVAVRWTGGY